MHSERFPPRRRVNAVVHGALTELEAGGATLVDIEIPDLGQWLVDTSLYLLKSKYDIDAFLAARANAPMKSVAEIVGSGRYHDKLDLLEGIAEGPDDPLSDLDYHAAYAAREAFMRLVVNLMTAHALDACVYPTAQVPPPRRAETDSGEWTTLTFPTNTLIGSQTWMPAMTVPAGFTDARSARRPRDPRAAVRRADDVPDRLRLRARARASAASGCGADDRAVSGRPELP